MNNYKNNFRRNRFKSNGDRHFRKRNGNGSKINGEFNNSLDFKRKNPGRNNQNASKLIEKYNDLAKEAISNGDKILSENYLQHADHFARILQSRETVKELSTNSINTDKDSEKNIQSENNSERNTPSE
tara:strand:+ start:927 stop:1310 length:384 start_codon:yes stop_codon:yes gene_type:complete